MFDPLLPPGVNVRGNAPMVSWTAKAVVSHSRPPGKIVGKDEPRNYYQSLTGLGDGRVLAGYAGRTVGAPRGLQIRSGDGLSVDAELEGAAPPYALHPDGRLLAAGPYVDGYQASVRLASLAPLGLRDTLPLRAPFGWLPGSGEWVGQTPHFDSYRQKHHVDSDLIVAHPYLEALVASRECRLVAVNPEARAARFLTPAGVGDEAGGWREYKHLVVAPDGESVYFATTTSVGAISIRDGALRWQRTLGKNDQANVYAVYALALSADGKRLAAGGISDVAQDGRNFVVLDARGGETVLEMPLARTLAGCGLKAVGNTSIRSLAWHPLGWIAVGTSSGIAAHVTPDGSFRAYKGAGKSIEALAFVDFERALLLAGSEKHFRAWPLFDDESARR